MNTMTTIPEASPLWGSSVSMRDAQHRARMLRSKSLGTPGGTGGLYEHHQTIALSQSHSASSLSTLRSSGQSSGQSSAASLSPPLSSAASMSSSASSATTSASPQPKTQDLAHSSSTLTMEAATTTTPDSKVTTTTSTTPTDDSNARAAEERILHLRNEIARKSASILQLQQLARELPRLVVPGPDNASPTTSPGGPAQNNLPGAAPRPNSRPYSARPTSFCVPTSHSLPSIHAQATEPLVDSAVQVNAVVPQVDPAHLERIASQKKPPKQKQQPRLEATVAELGAATTTPSLVTPQLQADDSGNSSGGESVGSNASAASSSSSTASASAASRNRRYSRYNSRRSSSYIEQQHLQQMYMFEDDGRMPLSAPVPVASSSLAAAHLLRQPTPPPQQQQFQHSQSRQRPLSLQPHHFSSGSISNISISTTPSAIPTTTTHVPSSAAFGSHQSHQYLQQQHHQQYPNNYPTHPNNNIAPNNNAYSFSIPQLTTRSSRVLINPAPSPTLLQTLNYNNLNMATASPSQTSSPAGRSQTSSPNPYQQAAANSNAAQSPYHTRPSHYNNGHHRLSSSSTLNPSSSLSPSSPALSMSPGGPNTTGSTPTQYLHVKTPSTYETHPSRAHWKTTSHVIESLQCTIDSLRRELAEQQARVDEERQIKEAVKKKVIQLESQMDGFRHQAETLSAMLQRKERRTKELELQVEHFRKAAGRAESERRAREEAEATHANEMAQAAAERERALVMYQALGDSIKRNKELYEDKLVQVSEQLRDLCGDPASSTPQTAAQVKDYIVELRKKKAEEAARITALKKELSEQRRAHAQEVREVLAVAQITAEEAEARLQENIKETLALVKTLKLQQLQQQQPQIA